MNAVDPLYRFRQLFAMNVDYDEIDNVIKAMEKAINEKVISAPMFAKVGSRFENRLLVLVNSSKSRNHLIRDSIFDQKSGRQVTFIRNF